jgi:hypothetical protein
MLGLPGLDVVSLRQWFHLRSPVPRRPHSAVVADLSDDSARGVDYLTAVPIASSQLVFEDVLKAGAACPCDVLDGNSLTANARQRFVGILPEVRVAAATQSHFHHFLRLVRASLTERKRANIRAKLHPRSTDPALAFDER